MTRRVSALFIDFDNVYVSLRNRDPRAAMEFQRNPRGWLRDLERLDIEELDTDEAPAGDGGEPAAARRRSFIIRRSYANPDTLKDARPFWTRGGFEVIDCPSLTQTGKNSADIYMVMDILDTLKDYPHVEEFVILSADADFTPVITRLRKFLKHTVIYANQVTAGAYRSAADSMIDEDDFIDLLRPVGPAPAATPAPLAAVALPGAAQPEPSASRPPPQAAQPAAPARARPPGNGNAPWWRRNAGPRTGAPEGQGGRASRADLAAIVRDLVAAEGDAPLAKIANALKFKAGTDWAGAGSFLALMRDLDVAPFYIDEATGQVRAPDAGPPSDDEPPAAPVPEPAPPRAAEAAEASPAPEQPTPALAALINRITGVTALPPLSAGTFEALFAAVPEAINANTAGDMVKLSRAVATRVERAGFQVSDRQAGFVLRGLQFQRHAFSADDAPAELAAKFRRQVLFLARNAGLTLDETDLRLLGDWVRASDEPLSGIVEEPAPPVAALAGAGVAALAGLALAAGLAPAEAAEAAGEPPATIAASGAEADEVEQDDLPIAFEAPQPEPEAMEPAADLAPVEAPEALVDASVPEPSEALGPGAETLPEAPAAEPFEEPAPVADASPEPPAAGPVEAVAPIIDALPEAPAMPVAVAPAALTDDDLSEPLPAEAAAEIPAPPAAEAPAPELTALAAVLADLEAPPPPVEAPAIDDLPPAVVAEARAPAPDAFDAIAMPAADLPEIEPVADPAALAPAAPAEPDLAPALAALPPLPEPDVLDSTPALPPVVAELPALDFDLDDEPNVPDVPAVEPVREIDLPLAELLADIEATPAANPPAPVPEVALSLQDLLADPDPAPDTAAPVLTVPAVAAPVPAVAAPVAADPSPAAAVPPIELALEDLLRDAVAAEAAPPPPAVPPAPAAEPPPIELALEDLIRDQVAPPPPAPAAAPPVEPPPAAEPPTKGRSFNAIFERLYAEKLQRMKGGDGSSGAG